MNIKRTIGVVAGVVVGLVALTVWYLHRHVVPVLEPAGTIGHSERNLLYLGLAISVPIVVPVFVLLGRFAWKYREENTQATYSPELGGNRKVETVWWLIPGTLMVAISIVTWRSSYALDPYKSIASNKATLHVQVISLDWKWLFIYPGQHVASVNEVAIPVGTPVEFDITSDSVMNSFWVPQLGGQMYSMTGMSTHLNLEASKLGTYSGRSANISGKGFADMTFHVKALSQQDYSAWMTSAKQHAPLTSKIYGQLAQPSTIKQPLYFSNSPHSLYDDTVMKYMMPVGSLSAVTTP